MKLVFGLILLMMSTTALADNPWKDLVGCYATAERNGLPVTAQDPLFDVSTISNDNKGFFLDLNGQPIDAVNLVLFEKYSDPDHTHYFDYFTAFSDRGQYTHDQNGRHYTFNGPLRIATYANPFTLTESIDVVQTDGSTLNVHVKRHIVEAGNDYDADDNYVLKSQPCR